MSDRDTKRRIASEPEDERPAPAEDAPEPRSRLRADDPARLFRPSREPFRSERATDFPWPVDERAADRLRRPQEERAARADRSRADDTDDVLARFGAVRRDGPVAVDPEYDPDPDPAFDVARDGRPSRAVVPGRETPAGRALPPADDPTDPSAWSDVTDQGWEETDAVPTDPQPPIAAPLRRGRPAGTARDRLRARAEGRAAGSQAGGAGRTVPRPTIGVPPVRIPTFVAGSTLFRDRTALSLLGAGLLGLAAMALLLASRIPNLDPSQVLHLDAAGRPDRWGPPRVLWRIPYLVAMTTLFGFGLAWWISRFDRFAARFVLGAALVVQLVAWVAVFDFV